MSLNNLRPAERRTRIANGFEALLFGSLESRTARFNIWEYMVTLAKRDLVLRFATIAVCVDVGRLGYSLSVIDFRTSEGEVEAMRF